MTIEEAIKIFSNYALIGTLEETGVDVAFDATPDQMRAAIEVVRSALRAQQEAEKNDPLILLREIIGLQKAYSNLFSANKITKKEICQLVIPYRDKYDLKDLEALRIARGELSLAEIEKFISSQCRKPVIDVIAPTTGRREHNA